MKIIIIGAGAAGLMAAKTLAESGVEVVLLEALDRIGGRINTYTPAGFATRIEAGAEFIHGNLPLTLELLKEAKIGHEPTEGEMYQFENARIVKGFGESKAWDEFYKAIKNIDQDCTVKYILDTQFADPKYSQLRAEVFERAQGLDLADVARLSVKSIRDEWQSDEKQYRPVGGYGLLIDWLHRQAARSAKFEMHLNQKVEEILWANQAVAIKTGSQIYTGNAVVLTLPAANYSNNIRIVPEINSALKWFEHIGFGEVIKIALEFSHPFWEKDYPDMGFLFSGNDFTFWTQLPQTSPLLVAWLGDGYAAKYNAVSDEELIKNAIDNLDTVFEKECIIANDLIQNAKVFRYGRQSFSNGGYSYLTPESTEAIININKGVADTIWFAGEALCPESGVGIVEAALMSGLKVANKMKAQG